MTRLSPNLFSRLRRFIGATAIIGAICVATPAMTQNLIKSGTVEIEQVQVAFIASGNLGGGTLHYKGRAYPFSISGLGAGGIGVSKIEATGNIYNLSELNDFAGVYGQARVGFAAGQASGGTLWLENTGGVYIELSAKREGLALSLGGDAIYISFK